MAEFIAHPTNEGDGELLLFFRLFARRHVLHLGDVVKGLV